MKFWRRLSTKNQKTILGCLTLLAILGWWATVAAIVVHHDRAQRQRDIQQMLQGTDGTPG